MEFIEVYLVGKDEDEAMSSLPFDSMESAAQYASDQPGPVKIYSVQAVMEFATMTLEETIKGR